MASSFGQLFRIMTWGESHGGGVGVVVDGCPPRLKLSEADIQPELDRRRPGQSRITARRMEPDTAQVLSGSFEGSILGTPSCLWVEKQGESNIGRCPDQKAAEEMIQLIDDIRQAGDTVGGTIEGIARGVPVGWGEPVFDKLGADLGKAMLSLPATKGFEIGSGFDSIL